MGGLSQKVILNGLHLDPVPRNEMSSFAPLPCPKPLPLEKHKVIILGNPHAGARKSFAVIENLAHELSQAGLASRVCWDLEELSDRVKTEGEELRCVVAAGGDGTVREVVNRAAGVPVALLPLGTENLLARYCDPERQVQRLAATIVAGHLRRFDLARVEDQVFCLMASAGFDAAVVHRLHGSRRGHISHFTYVFPILVTLYRYRYPSITVEVEDTGERFQGGLVLIFNLPCYGMGLPIGDIALPDDGLLDLVVFQRSGIVALAQYLVSTMRRRHRQRRDVIHRRARSFRLSSSEPVPLQIDGDPGGHLPVRIEVIPQALTLCVPGNPGAVPPCNSPSNK